MSPATAPPHFYTWGGKPYHYVLTLKGKPLGRNPNRVNPTVIPYSNANENDSHSLLVSCVCRDWMCRCLKGFYLAFSFIGLSMLVLSVPLMFLMYSPCLSLTWKDANGVGCPFVFFSNCSYRIKVRTYVLRVSTDRVLEGSIESTTCRSWHDSIMLYMWRGRFLAPSFINSQ